MEQHCPTSGTRAAVAGGNQPTRYNGTAQQAAFGAFEAFSTDEARMGTFREAISIVRGTSSWFAMWVSLTALRYQVFLFATKQISKSTTPLVHDVIQIFDIITQALDEYVADPSLPAAIRLAAARGRTMLNKYYGLTDDSIIYRIAMRKLFPTSRVDASTCTLICFCSFLQCCIPDTRQRISSMQDGLVSGLPPRNAFCVRSGAQTISPKMCQSRKLLLS